MTHSYSGRDFAAHMLDRLQAGQLVKVAGQQRAAHPVQGGDFAVHVLEQAAGKQLAQVRGQLRARAHKARLAVEPRKQLLLRAAMLASPRGAPQQSQSSHQAFGFRVYRPIC